MREIPRITPVNTPLDVLKILASMADKEPVIRDVLSLYQMNNDFRIESMHQMQLDIIELLLLQKDILLNTAVTQTNERTTIDGFNIRVIDTDATKKTDL